MANNKRLKSTTDVAALYRQEQQVFSAPLFMSKSGRASVLELTFLGEAIARRPVSFHKASFANGITAANRQNASEVDSRFGCRWGANRPALQFRLREPPPLQAISGTRLV